MMSCMSNTTHEKEKRLVISGVGLIGGSIAAAARERLPDCHIVGVGRSESRLQAAQEAGLIDEWSTEVHPDSACRTVCRRFMLAGQSDR